MCTGLKTITDYKRKTNSSEVMSAPWLSTLVPLRASCSALALLYSLFTHDAWPPTAPTPSSSLLRKQLSSHWWDSLPRGGQSPDILVPGQQRHLNVSKTEELIVDYRKRQGEEHAPLSINGTIVERVYNFRFLWVHISEHLTWTYHTDIITKSARQRLCNVYRHTTESILTCCITAWYSSFTTLNRMSLQRVVKTAQHITWMKLPSMDNLYTPRCRKKANRIDPNHPSHKLFCLLPSGRLYHSIQSRSWSWYVGSRKNGQA